MSHEETIGSVLVADAVLRIRRVIGRVVNYASQLLLPTYGFSQWIANVKPASADSSTPAPEVPASLAQFSVHIEGDLWTARDRLNYKTYYDAIRAFILSPRTTPPLSVGVQAKWGGGKSSLMRMIRAEFDPRYRGKTEANIRATERNQNVPPLSVDDAAKVIEQFRRDGKLAPAPAIPQPSSSGFGLMVGFNAWKSRAPTRCGRNSWMRSFVKLPPA